METDAPRKKKKKAKEPAPPELLQASGRCLHLSLPDGRKFLTDAQNLGVLIEFSRTFRAEVTLVELEEPSPTYSLEAMVAMICGGAAPAATGKHKVVEVKIKSDLGSVQVRGRRERAAEVTAYARAAMTERGTCSVPELMTKFPEIEKPVLSNVLNRAVQKMRREKYDIVREKVGIYKIVTPEKEEAAAC